MKLIIILSIVILNLFNIYSQEFYLITDIRNILINNIKLVNNSKNIFIDYNSFINSNNVNIFKNNNLEAIYFYNEKKILYKEINFSNIHIPIKIINNNFVYTLHIEENKIHISELFNKNNNLYYIIGIKNNNSITLLLFKLNLVKELLNKPITILDNNLNELISFNLQKTEIENFKTQIKEKSKYNNDLTSDNINLNYSLYRFKFFPDHNIYHLIIKKSNY